MRSAWAIDYAVLSFTAQIRRGLHPVAGPGQTWRRSYHTIQEACLSHPCASPAFPDFYWRSESTSWAHAVDFDHYWLFCQIPHPRVIQVADAVLASDWLLGQAWTQRSDWPRWSLRLRRKAWQFTAARQVYRHNSKCPVFRTLLHFQV